ncbi:ATP-binding protein [Thermomonospora umbrina]|nr:ATP-binding protein [Thermomonospora umbrina]
MTEARVTARARIVGWMLLLVGLALAASVLMTWSVLSARLNDRVNDELTHEANKLRGYVRTGVDPATGRPPANVSELLTGYLVHNLPDGYETFFSVVDGRAERRSAQEPMARMDRDTAFVARVAGLRAPSHGWAASPAGRVRYAVLPVRMAGDPRRASLVVVEFRDAQRAEVTETTHVLAITAFGALAVAGLVGWLIAGRVLAPIRLVRQTADQIGESDLTGRLEVRGNDDVAELATTFNRMLDRLECAFAVQRRFLDDAGHELRTPITVIRGHLELMDDDDDPAELEETRALLMEELDRMNRMVNDLLMLAKADRPDFLNLGEVDLAELTVDVVAKSRGLAPRRWRVAMVAEVRVLGDGQRLTQALMQLASNAVRHTGEGDTIEVGSAIRDGAVLLWVRDSGPGVAEEDALRIFERFVRVGSGPRPPDGSGLGLAIVASIARAHGGAAYVESPSGGGAQFVLDLPLRPVYRNPNTDTVPLPRTNPSPKDCQGPASGRPGRLDRAPVPEPMRGGAPGDVRHMRRASEPSDDWIPGPTADSEPGRSHAEAAGPTTPPLPQGDRAPDAAWAPRDGLGTGNTTGRRDGRGGVPTVEPQCDENDLQATEPWDTRNTPQAAEPWDERNASQTAGPWGDPQMTELWDEQNTPQGAEPWDGQKTFQTPDSWDEESTPQAAALREERNTPEVTEPSGGRNALQTPDSWDDEETPRAAVPWNRRNARPATEPRDEGHTPQATRPGDEVRTPQAMKAGDEGKAPGAVESWGGWSDEYGAAGLERAPARTGETSESAPAPGADAESVRNDPRCVTPLRGLDAGPDLRDTAPEGDETAGPVGPQFHADGAAVTQGRPDTGLEAGPETCGAPADGGEGTGPKGDRRRYLEGVVPTVGSPPPDCEQEVLPDGGPGNGWGSRPDAEQSVTSDGRQNTASAPRAPGTGADPGREPSTRRERGPGAQRRGRPESLLEDGESADEDLSEVEPESVLLSGGSAGDDSSCLELESTPERCGSADDDLSHVECGVVPEDLGTAHAHLSRTAPESFPKGRGPDERELSQAVSESGPEDCGSADKDLSPAVFETGTEHCGPVDDSHSRAEPEVVPGDRGPADQHLSRTGLESGLNLGPAEEDLSRTDPEPSPGGRGSGDEGHSQAVFKSGRGELGSGDEDLSEDGSGVVPEEGGAAEESLSRADSGAVLQGVPGAESDRGVAR